MLYLRIFILISLAGCATKKPNDYQAWAVEPTPEIFLEHSRWSVALLDKNGFMVRNLVVELSNEPAKTCSSGDFKKVKIISEHPARSDIFLGEPAYEVKGAALIIDLSANLCDAGYELHGKISNVGIEGYHQPVSMLDGKVVGRFYGIPLEQ